jgi:hypothetical protein
MADRKAKKIDPSTEIVVADFDGTDIVYLEPEGERPRSVNGRPSKRSLQDAQKTLNDNQLRLAVWLSVPESSRVPATKLELAKSLGVSEVTLYKWQKNPDVIMAVRWLQLNAAGNVGRVSDVLDFLYNTTQDDTLWMKDRLSAAKQWLQAVGVFEAWKYDNELLKVQTVDDFDLDSLSDDQLWDLYNSRAGAIGVENPDEYATGVVELANGE